MDARGHGNGTPPSDLRFMYEEEGRRMRWLGWFVVVVYAAAAVTDPR